MPVGTSGSAAVRATEGSKRGIASQGQLGRPKRKGRPPGATNKPKSMVPQELAKSMLLAMQGTVPAEHFAYLKGVVMDGKAISTKAELDTLILLLSRNLWSALIDEMNPPAEPESIEDVLTVVGETGQLAPKQVFRRDVTERLKVLNSLLSLRSSIEKREEDKPDDGSSALAKIWEARGMAGRVTVNVNVQSTPEPTREIIEGVAVPV